MVIKLEFVTKRVLYYLYLCLQLAVLDSHSLAVSARTRREEKPAQITGAQLCYILFFFRLSVVSLTVHLQINPFRPSPSHSATLLPIYCKDSLPVRPS